MAKKDFKILQMDNRIEDLERRLSIIERINVQDMNNRIGQLEERAFMTKEMFTLDEAAQYLGVSKSFIYKLTHLKEIPHTKLRGKLLYFKRTDLDEWVKSYYQPNNINSND